MGFDCEEITLSSGECVLVAKQFVFFKRWRGKPTDDPYKPRYSV